MRRGREAGPIDAPPGRYRVVEKDGRLVVVDNRTGAAAAPMRPPRTPEGMGAAEPLRLAAGTSAVDVVAAMVLRLLVRQWDEQGRAVIHWKWGEYGRTGHWDATLDEGQQRRFGRALLGLAASALLILTAFAAGLPILGFVAAAPFVARCAWVLNCLKAESDLGPGG